MRQGLRIAAWVVCVAALAGISGWWAGSRALQPPVRPLPPGLVPLALGDPWIDLELTDPEGRSRRLRALGTPPLVLNFWATWCPPCLREMPVLDAFAAEAPRHGVAVIGIALDEPQAVREFLARRPVRYPILLDRNAADDTSVRYGNTRGVLPYTVLVDGHGRIAVMHVGEVDRARLEQWAAAHGRR